MEKNEVKEKLNEVFRDVFDDENITVSEETTANDIAGWDSLMHIGLMSSVENAFGIQFEMKEVVNMANVGQMIEIILDKLDKK